MHYRAVRTTMMTLGLFMATACGGANYGYSKNYEPLSEEADFHDAADHHLSYEEVRRAPRGYAKAKLAWFGVSGVRARNWRHESSLNQAILTK